MSILDTKIKYFLVPNPALGDICKNPSNQMRFGVII